MRSEKGSLSSYGRAQGGLNMKQKKQLQVQAEQPLACGQYMQLQAHGRQGKSLITHIADAGARPGLIAEVVCRARTGGMEGELRGTPSLGQSEQSAAHHMDTSCRQCKLGPFKWKKQPGGPTAGLLQTSFQEFSMANIHELG